MAIDLDLFARFIEKEKEGKFENAPPKVKDLATKQVEVSKIYTDEKRFQNREGKYSERSVERIVANFDWEKFDPPKVWKDTKSGKIYIVSGHSRFEAVKRLGYEKMPVIFLEMTESEAINFGKYEANYLADAESLYARIRAFKNDKPILTLKELKLKYEDWSMLNDWQYLNQNGFFLEFLNAKNYEDFPKIREKAAWVGKLRSQYPDDISNEHENEFFNIFFFYQDKELSKKENFIHAVEQAIKQRRLNSIGNEVAFDLLNKNKKGIYARKDTADATKELEKLEAKIQFWRKHKSDSITKEERIAVDGEIKTINAQIQNINQSINKTINTQTEMRFSFDNNLGKAANDNIKVTKTNFLAIIKEYEITTKDFTNSDDAYIFKATKSAIEEGDKAYFDHPIVAKGVKVFFEKVGSIASSKKFFKESNTKAQQDAARAQATIEKEAKKNAPKSEFNKKQNILYKGKKGVVLNKRFNAATKEYTYDIELEDGSQLMVAENELTKRTKAQAAKKAPVAKFAKGDSVQTVFLDAGERGASGKVELVDYDETEKKFKYRVQGRWFFQNKLKAYQKGNAGKASTDIAIIQKVANSIGKRKKKSFFTGIVSDIHKSYAERTITKSSKFHFEIDKLEGLFVVVASDMLENDEVLVDFDNQTEQHLKDIASNTVVYQTTLLLKKAIALEGKSGEKPQQAAKNILEQIEAKRHILEGEKGYNNLQLMEANLRELAYRGKKMKFTELELSGLGFGSVGVEEAKKKYKL